MSVPQATCAVAIARCLNGQWSYCVEIKPPVVTTIQRLPQRVIESIRPTPGTWSPGFTVQTPSVPTSTAASP